MQDETKTTSESRGKVFDFLANTFQISDHNPGMRPIVEILQKWAFEDESHTLKQAVEWNLEAISCAGCHAPQGLIYNHEIAGRFVDFWEDIDDALDKYREDYNDRFSPETCGSLVWFAIEFWSHEMASVLRSEFPEEFE